MKKTALNDGAHTSLKVANDLLICSNAFSLIKEIIESEVFSTDDIIQNDRELTEFAKNYIRSCTALESDISRIKDIEVEVSSIKKSVVKNLNRLKALDQEMRERAKNV